MTPPEAVVGAEHQPDSKYDCRACGAPWPCALGRAYLLATTPDPVQLAMRLWMELEKASGVLANEPPADLFERFLKWSR